jgi:hypothetical protein
MSLRPVSPGWAAVSVACAMLMVISVLIGDFWATGIAVAGTALTGYQAYAPRSDDSGKRGDER